MIVTFCNIVSHNVSCVHTNPLYSRPFWGLHDMIPRVLTIKHAHWTWAACGSYHPNFLESFCEYWTIPESKFWVEIHTRNADSKSLLEILTRNPYSKCWLEILTRNADLKSLLEMLTRNPYSKCWLEILTRNADSKSLLEMLTRNPYSKCWLEILTRNADSKSRLGILTRNPDFFNSKSWLVTY